MTPLRTFARTVTQAYKLFDADRDVVAWLAFFEAKQAAYSALLAALPQVRQIEDFWRYVQNMPVRKWLPLIQTELDRVTHTECAICDAVLTWPKTVCDGCRKARRLETYRRAKERAQAVEDARKCRICYTTPLPYRGRSCRACQRKRAAERAKAYRKSLKEAKRHAFSVAFTKESNSTVCENDIKGHPPFKCGSLTRDAGSCAT